MTQALAGPAYRFDGRGITPRLYDEEATLNNRIGNLGEEALADYFDDMNLATWWWDLPCGKPTSVSRRRDGGTIRRGNRPK